MRGECRGDGVWVDGGAVDEELASDAPVKLASGVDGLRDCSVVAETGENSVCIGYGVGNTPSSQCICWREGWPEDLCLVGGCGWR